MRMEIDVTRVVGGRRKCHQPCRGNVATLRIGGWQSGVDPIEVSIVAVGIFVNRTVTSAEVNVLGVAAGESTHPRRIAGGAPSGEGGQILVTPRGAVVIKLMDVKVEVDV